jgi:hypothetical protein
MFCLRRRKARLSTKVGLAWKRMHRIGFSALVARTERDCSEQGLGGISSPLEDVDCVGGRRVPSLARDELQILAGIIERKEQVRLRQRNWVITLSLAFVSDNVGLRRSEYLALALSSIMIFWLMETVYQHVEDRAIRRSRDLEQVLREGRPYDGPLISDYRRRQSRGVDIASGFDADAGGADAVCAALPCGAGVTDSPPIPALRPSCSVRFNRFTVNTAITKVASGHAGRTSSPSTSTDTSTLLC